MNLDSFIRLPRCWQWGGTPVTVNGIPMPGEDCTTFVASWVLDMSGIDPAADLRGTYETAEEANAVIDRADGIVELIRSRIEPLGWHPVGYLEDGDIGVIKAISGVDLVAKQIPAIRFGPLWAVMSPRGAMVKRLDWTGVAWRSP